jgi:hypothetical protein
MVHIGIGRECDLVIYQFGPFNVLLLYLYLRVLQKFMCYMLIFSMTILIIEKLQIEKCYFKHLPAIYRKWVVRT